VYRIPVMSYLTTGDWHAPTVLFIIGARIEI
jgi:hypothetical protein